MKSWIYLLLSAVLFSTMAHAKSLNGFVLDKPLIAIKDIRHGGPPRDGIPALDKPTFIKAEQNVLLNNSSRVLGIFFNGEARAYPIAILDHHELVNDYFGDTPVLVSFCPLCGTGIAYISSVNGRKLDFGVSGLLYNSDVLMYDRQTNSLWSQILSQAINGSLKGERLQKIPIQHTTWKQWKKQYPNTLLLSHNTGYRRDYLRSPYGDYGFSDDIYFPVKHRDRRYHPKEVVVGVEIEGQYKAYPFVELAKSTTPIVDKLAGKQLQITFDPEGRSAVVTIDGQAIPSITAYWFAWIAFHPKTALYQHH